MKKLLLISALLAGVAGCTLAPKYERPAAPVSGNWPLNPVSTNVNAAVEIDWRDFFDDPRLRALIELSLTNNRDLRIAALRVEQSRAQYRIQRGLLFPTLDGNVSYRKQHFAGQASGFGNAFTLETYDLSVGAAYEVDLFGRVRSLKKQALEQYFALDETRISVQIALISEVASQYLTILQLQDELDLSRQTLAAVQSSYNLNQHSFEAGVASELDLRTAQAQVQTAQVNIATYQQLLSQAENALVLLIGQPLPNDLPPGRPLREQRLLTDIPSGLPSDLLTRRPDIRAAEHTLEAANANIGVARAALFPRILLTGSGGTASARLTDLFTGPSAEWSFGPTISVPLFQGGRGKANIDAAKAGKRIEVAGYERAIQIAFREVADALAVRSFVDAKLNAQSLLVEAQQKRFDLTNARYRQGIDSYVDVLLAQQDLYAAQQNYLQFEAARLINAVTLYRSLGGGWKS
jgi:multidrug efflux system outer membrane protein